MFFNFPTLFTAFLLSFMTLAQGAAISFRAAQDVYSPTIIEPNAQTRWVMGNVETVVWNASDAPVNISNRASVLLNGFGVLAKGFDLRDGKINVTVPVIRPSQWRRKYTVTLFGDSGNISPEFYITL